MGRGLDGCHVLVVDDEALIAMDLAEELEAAGAVVVGPASSIESARALLSSQEVNVALLDIRLADRLVYPLADALAAQGTPFVFATGLDAEGLPEKYADAPVCHKPFAADAVVHALSSEWERQLIDGS